jgi:hypothetical protein
MAFVHDGSITFPKMTQYNGDLGRVYSIDEGRHLGHVYPSITRVLRHQEKPEIKKWIARVGIEEAEYQRDRAGARGNIIHTLAECHLKGYPNMLNDVMPHIKEMWFRLRPWIDANVSTVYAQEMDVYSQKLGVAGRMDLLAEITHTFAVGDFKNSLRPKKEDWIHDYYLQGTFYAMCVYEHTGRVVKDLVFPVVSPEGIQVFTSKPKYHIEELVHRIATFYADSSQVISLDNQSKS